MNNSINTHAIDIRQRRISYPRIVYLPDAPICGGREGRFMKLIKQMRETDYTDFSVVLMSRDIHYPEVYDFGYPTIFLLRGTRRDIRRFRDLYRLYREPTSDMNGWV